MTPRRSGQPLQPAVSQATAETFRSTRPLDPMKAAAPAPLRKSPPLRKPRVRDPSSPRPAGLPRSRSALTSARSPAVPPVPGKSSVRFPPGACSCCLARSDREPYVKSWRGWQARRVPTLSHSEDHESFSTGSSMTSLLVKINAHQMEPHCVHARILARSDVLLLCDRKASSPSLDFISTSRAD